MTSPRLLVLALALLTQLIVPATAAPGPHGVQHVFLIVLENEDASKALDQPFLSKLAGMGALLTNYSGVTHPSQPNYFALTSGDTWGVTDDGQHTVSATNIADLIEEAGLSWKSYAEGYAGKCNPIASVNHYVSKHEPFLSYANVREDPTRCAKIVPAAQLDTDIAAGTLPSFALFVPDTRNDGHDTGVTFADAYLARRFGPLLSNPKFMNGTLFVVTFDEGGKHGNKVYTALFGDMIEPGSRSTVPYNHYNLLRTMEEELGLGTLGHLDTPAPPITGIFK